MTLFDVILVLPNPSDDPNKKECRDINFGAI